jgi:glycosyltransferase involved in cell wall biosynthesis
VPVLVVAHSDVLSWFEAVRRQTAPAEWARYREEVGRGLAAADLVVAPTRVMLDELRRHYSVTAPSCVIPNGVAPTTAAAVKRRVVLAAARLWDEAKNVSALVRVAPRIAAPVELAGELRSRQPSGVRTLGRLGRGALRTRMAETAVFCAPARYEPFGLAPLEAALVGCALVLGDIPSLREVWGAAALYVDPDDPDALVAALERALTDHAELGARARTHARGYGARRMAEAYADAYERLTAERLDSVTAVHA